MLVESIRLKHACVYADMMRKCRRELGPADSIDDQNHQLYAALAVNKTDDFHALTDEQKAPYERGLPRVEFDIRWSSFLGGLLEATCWLQGQQVEVCHRGLNGGLGGDIYLNSDLINHSKHLLHQDEWPECPGTHAINEISLGLDTYGINETDIKWHQRTAHFDVTCAGTHVASFVVSPWCDETLAEVVEQAIRARMLFELAQTDVTVSRSNQLLNLFELVDTLVPWKPTLLSMLNTKKKAVKKKVRVHVHGATVTDSVHVCHSVRCICVCV